MLTDYQRDVALAWLLRQRRRASHNADIWDLRFHREKYLNHIWQQVDNGEYRLLPPQLIRTGKQDDIVLWSAADALVMKWVALEIKDLLPLQSQCVRRLRLEEQARRKGLPEEAVRQRVQQYEARWMLWAERQIRSAVK
ncbi:hypothetical protein U9042_22475 [Escherichia coli]